MSGPSHLSIPGFSRFSLLLLFSLSTFCHTSPKSLVLSALFSTDLVVVLWFQLYLHHKIFSNLLVKSHMPEQPTVMFSESVCTSANFISRLLMLTPIYLNSAIHVSFPVLVSDVK